ncbi:MAG: polyprenyl synthetase family protein [Candidatus Methylarchaceae archaeon HK02M1]|nr:polyprenyl synthetase family protein [Candidatus Methylarchaceae archaeon HK02M1]
MEDYRSQIEKAIKLELERYKGSHFYKPLQYALEGGKRIRPIILLLSVEGIGRSKVEPLSAAIAIELLQTESLIHDDILDQEFLRRERPAFHVRYGLGASILTADFVFGIILDIALRYKDKRVGKELSLVALRMCDGEFGELKIDPKIYRLSWDEYINLISQKTASLFEASAKIGGIIGGGTEDEIEALSSYGYSLGIAYQIQDDALDWDKVSNALEIEQKGQDKLSYLKKMAELYAMKAKQKLNLLSDTKTKKHLLDLADLMISYRF